MRTTAVVTRMYHKVARFEVEAFDGDRKISDGRHARGLVNMAEFNKRFGVS